jgi:anti-sigma factor RsiW
MTCADFQKSFDQYVDDVLEPQMAEAAGRHVASCPVCDREVTGWQQTRILLSTAVADLATAVDVSGVCRGVEAALGLAADHAWERRQGAMREAVYERGSVARRHSGHAARAASSTAVREAAGRHGGFAAAWRFASAATVSASIAAAAVLLLTPAPTTNGPVVASAPRSTVRSSFQAAAYRPGSRKPFADVAPVAYTPPPLAKPEVSHVDGLEAASGHLVSTWVQPRTNARVIWVQNRGLGTPVRMAGLER